jgi:proton-translocating NAD(P)+ transhydrogenase subunit alpha
VTLVHPIQPFSMLVGVPTETFPGERRVALVPAHLPGLRKAGLEVVIEAGAGAAAGFPDGEYVEQGARLGSRYEAFAAEIVVQVRSLGANLLAGRTDLELLRSDQVVVGLTDPLAEPQAAREVAARGCTSFSMELIPRITRAQSMDVLSSMATISGYKTVLLAADALPKMFPMMMTAAGTLTAAKVFVVGAGVAGLQAIATAKRLGAIVLAYDVRPVVKEQIESLGGKYLDLGLETGGAQDAGGYAKALGDEFYRRQREAMLKAVAENDVVITTAAVPGKKSPILVTKEMVAAMRPGTVIVDMAAERGGNCELTRPGETFVHDGVTIIGPLNLPSSVPHHASQMYSKNVTTFLQHLVKKGVLTIDTADEITRETLVTQGGEVVQPKIRELLGVA